MEWIENQPVFFGDTIGCSCDEEYPQLSDNTDTIQVQFNIDNCGSVNFLQDYNDYPYNDWFVNDGWSISDGLLCHSGTGLAGAGMPIPVAIAPLGYYQFTIVVDSFNGVGSMGVYINNLADGVDLIGTITGVGTWNFYTVVTPSSNPTFPNTFILLPTAENVDICFSSITGYNLLTNGIIAVYNSDGTYLSEISYDNDPTKFIFSQDSLTISLEWADLNTPASNGCFYLGFLDPCENTGGQNYSALITNPMFAGNADGWTLEGDATYFDESIVFGGTDYAFISQSDVFNAYINQCIYIDVSSLTGSLIVEFGTETVATITTTGTHKICGVPVGNLNLTIAIADGETAIIENVRPITIAVNGTTIPFPTADYVPTLTSNTFKLANYTNACTMLINACNNEDGLGFTFDSTANFSPRIRLEAKLNGMKYPSERNIYEDSLGTKKVISYKGRKAKFLSVDIQPEYVHDFLRLLMAFDNFYIDGVSYAVEDDEYTVETIEATDNVGKTKILVSKKTQNVENKNCSGTELSCILA